MSGHVVTFEARAHTSAAANNTRAALVARCACGWTHVFVPNAGREHAILAYGLEHVRDVLDNEKGERLGSPVP